MSNPPGHVPGVHIPGTLDGAAIAQQQAEVADLAAARAAEAARRRRRTLLLLFRS